MDNPDHLPKPEEKFNHKINWGGGGSDFIKMLTYPDLTILSRTTLIYLYRVKTNRGC